MKTVNVACCLIEYNNKTLICQRNDKKFKDMWEFPGGKIEENETSVEAITREIREELNLIINNPTHIFNVTYNYDDFKLNMEVFKTKIYNIDNIHNNVHKNYIFIDLKNINQFIMLPADYLILDRLEIKNRIHNFTH